MAKAKQLELPAMKLKRVRITLKGRTPLITNRFSERAIQKLIGDQTGIASVGREPRNPEQEYEDSMYRTEDGYGFPTIGFKKAAVNAANDVGLFKTDMKRAFHVIGPELTLLESDPPFMRTDIATLNGKVAYPVFRAQFDNWSVTVEVIYNAGVISLEQLVNLFRVAGFGVGIGAWRPGRDGVHGTWDVAQVAEMTMES